MERKKGRGCSFSIRQTSRRTSSPEQQESQEYASLAEILTCSEAGE
ncbi:unnamed protein product [Gulo gulo]|uniref:Uncharacterized protein n=1 Tax=Gulo gulo TaxID=48420 RepID=A0A9X9M8J2_GULGU|nr:unnamed protein product [Gulo gulo]